MTQGIFVNGYKRPASKKQIKELAMGDPKKGIAATPERVIVEATSMFPGEFGGRITDMEAGQKITFVGPDPHNKRSFYGTIKCVLDESNNKSFKVE